NPRRTAELRQLERRFRNSYKMLSDSAVGDTVISLDITPTDPDMQGLDICQFTANIRVGRQYPEDLPSSLAISINDGQVLGRKGKPSSWQPAEGRQVYLDHIAKQFSQHVKESPMSSILHHLNWLDHQLVPLVSVPPPPDTQSQLQSHTLAQATTYRSSAADQPAPAALAAVSASERETAVKSLTERKTGIFGDLEEQKPWVKTISLEEAGVGAQDLARLDIGSSSSDSFSEDGEKDHGDSAGEEENLEEEEAADTFSKPIRRGIEIRLGRIQLTNISLAHCHSLNLNVRCARCKSMVELKGIPPTLRVGKDNQ
ncbi:hypothetical protein LPJ56_007064, partial [Coemansia sp. RSA 2599]